MAVGERSATPLFSVYFSTLPVIFWLLLCYHLFWFANLIFFGKYCWLRGLCGFSAESALFLLTQNNNFKIWFQIEKCNKIVLDFISSPLWIVLFNINRKTKSNIALLLHINRSFNRLTTSAELAEKHIKKVAKLCKNFIRIVYSQMEKNSLHATELQRRHICDLCAFFSLPQMPCATTSSKTK